MSTRYGKYTITYDPKPIPIRTLDFDFVHDDYDGGDVDYDTPSRDRRCGNAASVEDAIAQIDELEADMAEEAAA